MPAEARPGSAPAILGYFGLTTDWRLEGWCWSPDAPTQRQMVEITVNGIVVATTVAAQFNEMLRQAGMGDGRCGFSLSPPRQIGSATDGESVVEAIAQLSGTRLGRVVFHPQRALTARMDRLATIAAAIAAHRAQLPAAPPRRLQAVGAAMACFGATLKLYRHADTAGALDDVIARLLREIPVQLHPAAAPRISLILRAAADWRVTLAALRHVAKALPRAADVILLDDGKQPINALLGICTAGLRMLHLPSTSAASGINQAARISTGRTLCIVEAADQFVAWTLAAHINDAGAATFGASAAGQLAHDSVGRTIAGWRQRPMPDGISALVDRDDFMAVGGVEQSSAGAFPAWDDFACKLAALGVTVTAYAERSAHESSTGLAAIQERDHPVQLVKLVIPDPQLPAFGAV